MRVRGSGGGTRRGGWGGGRVRILESSSTSTNAKYSEPRSPIHLD